MWGSNVSISMTSLMLVIMLQYNGSSCCSNARTETETPISCSQHYIKYISVKHPTDSRISRYLQWNEMLLWRFWDNEVFMVTAHASYGFLLLRRSLPPTKHSLKVSIFTTSRRSPNWIPTSISSFMKTTNLFRLRKYQSLTLSKTVNVTMVSSLSPNPSLRSWRLSCHLKMIRIHPDRTEEYCLQNLSLNLWR